MTTSLGGDETGVTTVPAGAETAAAPVLRGQTVVTPRALAAVAGKAASEVDGVEVVSRSGLRRFLSGLLPGSGGAPASASVATASTALELRLSVTWPQPVAEVAQQARRHVRARVEELTGYVVSGVDVVVDSLPAVDARPGRRVR
jgi:uncharacterized alkaline shock family protein YloU